MNDKAADPRRVTPWAGLITQPGKRLRDSLNFTTKTHDREPGIDRVFVFMEVVSWNCYKSGITGSI